MTKQILGAICTIHFDLPFQAIIEYFYDIKDEKITYNELLEIWSDGRLDEWLLEEFSISEILDIIGDEGKLTFRSGSGYLE